MVKNLDENGMNSGFIRTRIDASVPSMHQGTVSQPTRKCGGNVHENGALKGIGSGTWTGALRTVIDYETNDDGAGSWIGFDFKEKAVGVDSCSLGTAVRRTIGSRGFS